MKKIWKSNITGEILFLLGVILLWQILYMIGVDGLEYGKPMRCRHQSVCGIHLRK